MFRIVRVVVVLIATCCAWSINLQAQTSRAKEKPSSSSQAAKAVKVEIVSLQMTKLKRDEFGNGLKPGTTESVAFWLANSGTAVNLVVKMGRPISGFEEESSRLIRFVDDKGTDLTQPPDGRPVNTFFPSNKPVVVKLGPRPGEADVILRGYGTPAPGATKMTIHADLAFLVGTNERSVTQKGIDPKPGTQAAVGPMLVTFKDPGQFGAQLGRVAPEKADARSMTVAFDYGPLAKPIKELVFLDSAGESIKTLESHMFAHGRGGSVSFTMPKAARIDMKLVYYERSDEIAVPVRLETGVGF
jgi:hypothetical protein